METEEFVVLNFSRLYNGGNFEQSMTAVNDVVMIITLVMLLLFLSNEKNNQMIFKKIHIMVRIHYLSI